MAIYLDTVKQREFNQEPGNLSSSPNSGQDENGPEKRGKQVLRELGNEEEEYNF